MPIPVSCPGCNHAHTVPDTYAQRQVSCTNCRTTIVVGATKTLAPNLKGEPRRVEEKVDVELVKLPRVKASSRELAAVGHLIGTMAFLGLPVLGALGIWLAKRRIAPFVAMHAKEAFNFQLNIVLLGVLAVVGYPYLESWHPNSGGYWLLGVAALFLYSAGLSCYASWVASQGKYFSYPVTLRVVR
jgi:uncharacterized Tic20 family protein